MGCSLGFDSPALAQAVLNTDNGGNATSDISGSNMQGAPAFSIQGGQGEAPLFGQTPVSSPETNNNISTTTPLSNVQGMPPFGTSLTLGEAPSLSAMETSPSASNSANNREILVTPSLGIEEDITNTDFSKPSGQAVGLVTTIMPGLLLEGRGANSDDIILDYQPRINLYSGQGDQNQITQAFNGAGNLTLIQNSLTVATRGYVTEQATSGGVNPGGTNLLARNNTTTTQSYSVSPTYLHSFDGSGTLDINYLFSYTRQGGNAAYLTSSSQPYFNSGDLTAQTEIGFLPDGSVF